MCGAENTNDILDALHRIYPEISVVLTKGEIGSEFIDKNGEKYSSGAIKCDVVDTTAAGDTFTGYFLHELFERMRPEDALLAASVASGISVTRKGASPSIPFSDEVRRYTKAHFRPQQNHRQ